MPQRKDKRRFNKVSGLTISEVSLVDDPASPGASVVLFKAKEGQMTDKTKTGNPGDNQDYEALAKSLEDTEAKVADLNKQVETLTAERDQAQADLAKARAGEVDPYDGLPDNVKAILKKRDADNEELQKRLDAAEDRAATEQTIAKVRSDFPNLPVKAEDFGPVLKRVLKGATAEDRAEVERVLKAASAAVDGTKLTKELGDGGDDKTKSATAQLDSMAKAKAAEKGVSYYVAYSEVLSDNPELYQQSLTEGRQ